jgi:hypothetical protein
MHLALDQTAAEAPTYRLTTYRPCSSCISHNAVWLLTSRALANAFMNSCDLPGMARAWSRSARDNCITHVDRAEQAGKLVGRATKGQASPRPGST